MNENIWTVLIIAVAIVVAVIVVVYLLRDRLKGLNIRAGKVKAGVQTHESKGVDLSGIRQDGEGHTFSINRGDVNASEIEQKGKGHTVAVGTEPGKSRKT